MVWDINTSRGRESDKIAAFVIQYTRGRGLDIGCGLNKVWPHAIGVDNGHHFGDKSVAEIKGDGSDLSLFADKSMDFVFSSHVLEHFPEEQVDDILAEWSRVIKIGGHLILYLPSGNLYPRCKPTLQPGANPDHKWDIYPGDAEKHLRQATVCGWTQLENEERSDYDEYSLFEVYQKRDDGIFEKKLWQRNPDGKKRALVIRYGAIGDQLIAASILPGLKRQGYHITYNTTPDAQQILLHNPYIDEWLLQDKDQVPNVQLGAYWQTIAPRYDKVVNLSESIEGALLTLPGRPQHSMPDTARRKMYGFNYLEMTHDYADVPHEFAQKFHPSDKERYAAEKLRKSIKAPVIVWPITGSALHKIYPWVDIVMAWILERTPAHVFLYADAKQGVDLQKGIIASLTENKSDLTRLHTTAGDADWPIRKSLAFALQADCVVGPETGILNAVAFEDMAKVIYLSHSSEENLTKHWKNTRTLTPPASACPCFPCHKLHYTWEFCKKVEETQAALCASSITPEELFKAIVLSIGAQERQAA